MMKKSFDICAQINQLLHANLQAKTKVITKFKIVINLGNQKNNSEYFTFHHLTKN